MGPHVEAAILGVYTFASGLRDAQQDLCGPGSKGMCDRLAELSPQLFYTDYLSKVDFTFTKQERIPTLSSGQVCLYGMHPSYGGHMGKKREN